MSDSTTKTKASRNNHAAAEAHPITDAASAQAYADAVASATASDTPSNMVNGSGFVTPGQMLKRQDTANLRRMLASITSEVASRVGNDGTEGIEARDTLTIAAEHARSAGALQEEAKNKRICDQADAIRAKQRTAKQHN